MVLVLTGSGRREGLIGHEPSYMTDLLRAIGARGTVELPNGIAGINEMAAAVLKEAGPALSGLNLFDIRMYLSMAWTQGLVGVEEVER